MPGDQNQYLGICRRSWVSSHRDRYWGSDLTIDARHSGPGSRSVRIQVVAQINDNRVTEEQIQLIHSSRDRELVLCCFWLTDYRPKVWDWVWTCSVLLLVDRLLKCGSAGWCQAIEIRISVSAGDLEFQAIEIVTEIVTEDQISRLMPDTLDRDLVLWEFRLSHELTTIFVCQIVLNGYWCGSSFCWSPGYLSVGIGPFDSLFKFRPVFSVRPLVLWDKLALRSP